MAPFLQNTWYMAGWSAELTTAMLTRTLLNLPVVLYREQDGTPVALVNRCPHRFAPLSRGKIVGDHLQCGYHGLAFDRTGACVSSPYSKSPPAAAKVRSFPVKEQDRILWIWFGDVDKADTALIPRFEYHENPQMRTVSGKSLVRAHYELVADNLMDLSHTTFIHPAFGGAFWVPQYKLEQQGDTVIANYAVPDAPPSPFSEGFFPAHGRNINEYTKMRWNAPASMYLDIRWSFPDQPDEITAWQPSSHILTPETEGTTHYFWASAASLEAPITDEEHRATLIQAFDIEDTPMLESCADSMAGQEFWSMRPVLLPYDSAAVRARRILGKFIEAERDARPATSVI